MSRKRLLQLLLLLPIGLTPSGCEKPLLSDQEERSPFDRYDTVRNQYSDQYLMDEFGRRRPNLRERLQPKD